MRKFIIAAFLPALAAIAGTGCETTKLFQGDPENHEPEDAEWQSTEPLTVPSFEVLWERSRAILEVEGYELDEVRTRFDRNLMVSRWLNRLAPNRFEGTRRRVHVTFTREASQWVVHAAVIRQRNVDIDNPQNGAQAQWEEHGADTSRTALIVWKIRAGFDPALVGADVSR